MIFDDNFNIIKSFHATKTQYNLNQLTHEDIDLESIDFSKKSIIILCGNDTRSTMKANNYAKNMFRWIIENPNDINDINVYSLYYPSIQPLNNNLRPNPSFDYSELSRILYNKIFYKNNKLLSTDEIIFNLNNITFFGHSIGGHVMNELMYAFKEFMLNDGFSRADMEKIFSSIVFVGYAPFDFVEAPTNNIYITPLHDSVGSTKLAFDRMKDHNDLTMSNPNIEIDQILNNLDSYHFEFIEKYQSANQNHDILLAKYNKNLAIIPDLLYDDGIKEDHNLAGITFYSSESPYFSYKTKTGKKTTDLLKNIFSYILSTDRQKFSIDEIYNKANIQLQNTQNNLEKEL